jgi:uncharacterized metal-binding protein
LEKPTKSAIYLSALMAPGAGQIAQLRWLAGAIYLTVFLIVAVFFLVEILRPMVNNIMLTIEYAANLTQAPLAEYRIGRILIWLGLMLAVYLASLLDTWAGYARQCREWARQHSRLPPIPSLKENPNE